MRTIETYGRFHRHIAAWVDREIDPLFILGQSGVGKSHAYKVAIGNRPHHHFIARQRHPPLCSSSKPQASISVTFD